MGFFDSIKNAARDAQRQADAMAQEVAHKAQQVIETDDRRKLDELVGQLDSNADAWIAGLDPSLTPLPEEATQWENSKFSELTQLFLDEAKKRLGRDPRE
jgi:hypothetical protein